MGNGAEGIIFDFRADVSCFQVGGAQSFSYGFCQREQDFCRLFSGSNIRGEGGGVADSLGFGLADLHPGIIPSVGVVPEGKPVAF